MKITKIINRKSTSISNETNGYQSETHEIIPLETSLSNTKWIPNELDEIYGFIYVKDLGKYCKD